MTTLNDLLWHGLGCIQSFRHTHSHDGAHHRFYCPFEVQKMKTKVEFITMRIFTMRQYHRQQQEPARETNSLTRGRCGFLTFFTTRFQHGNITKYHEENLSTKSQASMHHESRPSTIKAVDLIFSVCVPAHCGRGQISPIAPTSPRARPDFSDSAHLTAGEARFLR